jgi:hypothetical protein
MLLIWSAADRQRAACGGAFFAACGTAPMAADAFRQIS